MSATVSTYTEPSAMRWTGRILSGVVVLFLLLDGGMKLVPFDVVVESSRQFGIPLHLTRVFGALLLIGTVLYALPRTAMLGAIIITGYLGGAIYIHLAAGSPLFTHTLFGVYLGLMTWGGLYLRDAQVRALIPFRY